MSDTLDLDGLGLAEPAAGRRWNRPGVPHRGWYCVDVYDDLGDEEYSDDGLSFACEMCGTHIRFVHVMQHPDYPNPMSVGCVCAEHMSEDYAGPKQREKNLKARIRSQKRDAALKEEKRKAAEERRIAAERWKVQVRQAWLDPNRWKPAGGNVYGSICANGFDVAVFKKPDGWGFMIWWGRGNWPSREVFGSAEAAAASAIDSVIETSMRGRRDVRD